MTTRDSSLLPTNDDDGSHSSEARKEGQIVAAHSVNEGTGTGEREAVVQPKELSQSTSKSDALKSDKAAARTFGDEEDAGAAPATSKSKVEAFEIEMGRAATAQCEISDDELDDLVTHGARSNDVFRRARSTSTSGISIDDRPANAAAPSEEEPGDDDMESLLGGAKAKQQEQQPQPASPSETASSGTVAGRGYCVPCCYDRRNGREGGRSNRLMGNIRVVFPRLYTTTGGWGVLGPHWLGPPCIVGILLFASYYFIYERSWKRNLPVTAATCSVLALTTLYHLINAAYRDPGVIVQGCLVLPEPVPRSYLWCETCNYYQPPKAAHCPDCNVCVAGFDHHCVWMSICIGVGNFKPFMRFNLSWMAYLSYAIVWVSIVAPIVYRH